ncbi:MAG: hypothetical protein PUB17_07645 [Lachnospiraceae bacterium]|nr:hypothetical protein [Lachnospiraceae bacterium]
MRKQIITFIVLAAFVIAGAVWIGYDTARISEHNYETDTRDYEPAAWNRKLPDSPQPATERKIMYHLKAEYGYVSIYKADGKLYDNTDIRMSFLPQSVQIEIINVKDLYSDKELYEFLETYSS